MPRFTEEEIQDARYQLSNQQKDRKGLYPLIKNYGKKILKIEKMNSRDLEDLDDLELDLKNPIREQRKNKHLSNDEIREKIQIFNQILERKENEIKKYEEVIETFYKKLPKFEKKLDSNELHELMIKFNLIYSPNSYGSRPIYEKLYKFRNPSYEIYFDEQVEPTEDEVERMTPISRSEYETDAMLNQIRNRDDYNYVDYGFSGGAKKSHKKRKTRKVRKTKKKKGAQRRQIRQKRKTRKQK